MTFGQARLVVVKTVFAVAAVAAVVGLRAALQPVLGTTSPLILFLIPVAGASWFGGFWPGLVATVLGGVLGILLFTSNAARVEEHSMTFHWLSRGVPFLLVGGFISFMAARLDRARRLADENGRGMSRSEARQQQIFESARDFAIFTTDLAGVLTSWNSGAERLFGQKRADAIGRASDVLWTPEDRAAGVPAAERAKAGRGVAEDRRWHQRQDGSRFFANGTMRTLHGDRGEAIGYVKVCRDDTAAKAAADALAASEARFRELADAMPQIVFAATPDGDVDYFNRRWYEFTGLPAGSTGYVSWKRAFEPHLLDRIVTAWGEAVQAGKPYELEYPLLRHDGVARWQLARALPVRNENGDITRWFGAITDIHDQKRLREEAEAARLAAEQAGRAKDDFLATISHELRTPLSAITGWAHLLREVASPAADPDTLAEGLAVIHRNAQVQSQLIEDILDVSRITTGKLRLHPVALSLRQPVDAAIATVRTAADAKGVTVVVDFESDARLTGDPDRLQQVFWNLLANAIKFTDRGGAVTVRQQGIESQCVVTVTDTGRGIGSEFLPFVFDRFRQADMSTTRRHGGLGLGLAIVRHLVELHGGRVSVDSPGEGRGSTFRVELPVSAVEAEPVGPAAMSSRPAVAEAAAGVAGLRVLVLDDEPDARRMLQATLARRGVDTVLVGDVAAAMALVAADADFDAVLSDIGLPDEDGYVFIRRLRALETDRRSPRTPAVALTAYTRPSDRAAVLAAGFDHFLAKPVEPGELFTLLRSIVPHG